MTREINVGKTKFVKSVGSAIARQRKLAKMTQSQVAEKLGIEKESLSRMETGAISPTLTRLEQLGKIFCCPVRHFFWHESGDEQTQADTIADMIQALPEEKRRLVVRFVAEVVRVLK
jgi:transcriptional regulator with XRE-family HTH domain